jgi:ABC-type Mn2+/Zn2+ transport system permease subunit
VRWFTDPWILPFFKHGMIAAVLAGALTGLIGIYIVLRRMSYIGHGLSHAIFGGAVLGYVVNGNFYVTGGIWGALSALLINAVSRTRKVGADAAIGIVTTGSFAVGVALISRGHRFTRNFDAALFGNVLSVTTTDLWILAGATLLVSAAVFLFYKQLLFLTFDPDVAASYGVRTGLVDVVFSLVLAAAIIATMQVLGVTLIASAIVTPAVVARLTTNSFGKMLLASTAIGAATGFVGMYVSYYADIASGATITLTAVTLFIVVYVATLARYRRARRAAGRGAPGDESARAADGGALAALGSIDVN